MSISSIKKALKNVFQGILKNLVSLADDSPLDNHLKPLKIGDKTTNIELSEDEVYYKGKEVVSGDIEGTEIKSTGETGGTKFLREDGDGTCSWQTAGGSSTTFRFIINGGFNFNYSDGTRVWIPLSARDLERTITQTGQNELLAFVPHYDGYLNQVIFRSEAACDSTTVGLHRSATGTEIPNQTPSNTVTVDMTTDDTPYKFSFGASASFNAGEILGISFQPSDDANDTVFTAEFILDSSSGL
tara:strand:+ start:150 stop:878 length:729 start_codon:yes stop_codon:yes gene_type:complete